MSRALSGALALWLAFMVIGCASANNNPALYYWGSYQQQIYASYNDAGSASPEQQLQQLEADFEKARAANRPVPPGYHAHMGYLYFQVGRLDQAVQAFTTEKTLFPESTIYMDRLIAQIKR
jgi:hypothetical protein